jgi:predicted dehydrogenase
MGKTLKGILIGCGSVCDYHLHAWQKVPGAEIIAVCDLQIDRAKKRAAEYGIPRTYADIETAIEENPPDFLDIATRPASHGELIRTAAGGKIPVLCQKPFAETMEECREMVSLCARTETRLMVNENFRHQAWFRRLKELITEGRLGRPFYCRFHARNRGSMDRNGFSSQDYFLEMSKFIILELGVHLLDTARYLFGEAAGVYARTSKISPYPKGEDFAQIMVGFDGVTCVIDTSWASFSLETDGVIVHADAVVEGTEGTAVLTPGGVLHLVRGDGTRSWPFAKDTIRESYTATHRHFIECLDTGRDFETSGEDTLRTMELVFAAYKCAASDSVVEVRSD